MRNEVCFHLRVYNTYILEGGPGTYELIMRSKMRNKVIAQLLAQPARDLF